MTGFYSIGVYWIKGKEDNGSICGMHDECTAADTAITKFWENDMDNLKHVHENRISQ